MNSTPPNTPPGPSGAEVPPITLEGWYTLHQAYRLDWASLKSLDPSRLEVLAGDLVTRMEAQGEVTDAGWSGLYRIAGSSRDLVFLHFREDLEGVLEAQHEVVTSALADFVLEADDALSVVELGLYGLTVDLASRVDPSDADAWAEAVAESLAVEREKTYVQRRLHPVQPPDMPYICYYPMDKRREPEQNWYTLPIDERAALMASHGALGRRYAGRLSQVIGGSLGLDDWEWTVTLWAGDPLEFKKVITDMRYDEVSSVYADFGAFRVGRRLEPSSVREFLMGESA